MVDKKNRVMAGAHDLERLKKEGTGSLFPAKTKIMVGMATCGQAAGAQGVWKALVDEVKKRKLDDDPEESIQNPARHPTDQIRLIQSQNPAVAICRPNRSSLQYLR